MYIFNSNPVSSWRQYSKRYRLGGLGTLISYTNITNPCAEFKHMNIYCIGLIQLDDGPRLTVQLADVDLKDLKIGMRVRATFRKFYSRGKSGIIEYGLKFVPYEFK